MSSTVLLGRVALLGTALALVSACGGGGAPGTAPAPASAPAGTSQPTSFFITVPRATGSAARRPAYVSSASRSIVIALATVNGLPVAVGSSSAVTSSVAGCSAGCTIPGPSAPQGNDAFIFTLYDGNNGTGNVLGTATATVLVIAGAANTAPVSILGVPGKVTLAGLPAGAAGTSVTATALTVTVADAAGQTIAGPFANAVTLSSSLVSGAVALSVNNGNFATSVTLTASTDTVQFAYSGAAIAPVTLTATSSGAPNATATFAPVLAPIQYTGPLAGGVPTVHLPAGGSSASFSAAETGFSGSPYSNVFSAVVPTSCATIATVSPSSGTSFTATAVASPTPGSCTVTIGDSLGQTLAVTVTNP